MHKISLNKFTFYFLVMANYWLPKLINTFKSQRTIRIALFKKIEILTYFISGASIMQFFQS